MRQPEEQKKDNLGLKLQVSQKYMQKYMQKDFENEYIK